MVWVFMQADVVRAGVVLCCVVLCCWLKSLSYEFLSFRSVRGGHHGASLVGVTRSNRVGVTTCTLRKPYMCISGRE